MEGWKDEDARGPIRLGADLETIQTAVSLQTSSTTRFVRNIFHRDGPRGPQRGLIYAQDGPIATPGGLKTALKCLIAIVNIIIVISIVIVIVISIPQCYIIMCCFLARDHFHVTNILHAVCMQKHVGYIYRCNIICVLYCARQILARETLWVSGGSGMGPWGIGIA